MTPFRLLLIVAMIGVITALGMTSPAYAQRGYGMHQTDRYQHMHGEDWSYCPYCGSGLNRGGIRGMSPGIMDRYHNRPYDNPDSWYYNRDREPLETEDARDIVQDMLVRSLNPNLKIGRIEEKDDFFEVEMLTQQDSLVDKMQVHKRTGLMRSIY